MSHQLPFVNGTSVPADRGGVPFGVCIAPQRAVCLHEKKVDLPVRNISRSQPQRRFAFLRRFRGLALFQPQPSRFKVRIARFWIDLGRSLNDPPALVEVPEHE